MFESIAKKIPVNRTIALSVWDAYIYIYMCVCVRVCVCVYEMYVYMYSTGMSCVRNCKEANAF